MAKRKRKSVPKDKRARLAAVLKRISKLYKEGKTVPRSLIQERIRLGRMKRATRKKR